MILHKELQERGYSLILASQSPRRRELMQAAGLEFRVERFDVEEIFPPSLPPEEVAEYLSRLKCEGYPHTLEEREILITADTVVLLRGEVLGKPKSEVEAVEMLTRLSGEEHLVVTGVTIRSLDKSHSFSTTTRVHFAELSREQIEYYVGEYRPLDKAGSYGIQEWIGYVGIESIEGSFYNVMGLPIQRLCSELGNFVE